MINVETQVHHRYRGHFRTAPIRVHLSKGATLAGQPVELSAYRAQASVLRLLDAQGIEIWREGHLEDPAEFCTEVSIQNLQAGTYYVEIQDGFFHQIRMVQVAA